MSSLDQVPLVYGDSYQKFPKLANFESNPWQATVEHYFATLFSGIDTFRELLITIGILFGIDAPQVQASQIGFSDRSLGNQLPANAVLPGKAIRTKLEELGIYKPNGRETLRGFVTIHSLIHRMRSPESTRSESVAQARSKMGSYWGLVHRPFPYVIDLSDTP